MYAMKDITYGDEMSFDYSAVTESTKEYQQALCLCVNIIYFQLNYKIFKKGTIKCRIRYLELAS